MKNRRGVVTLTAGAIIAGTALLIYGGFEATHGVIRGVKAIHCHLHHNCPPAAAKPAAPALDKK